LEIEDIQQLRWKQGIEDLELRAGISGLQLGDSVNLTFRADTPSLPEPIKLTHRLVLGYYTAKRLQERSPEPSSNMKASTAFLTPTFRDGCSNSVPELP
jgi:hypothetical protein